MKFKSYAIFFVLFGVIPDIYISWALGGGVALALLWLPTLIAAVYLVRIKRGVDYTESLKVFSYLIFICALPKLILTLFHVLGAGKAVSLAAGIAVGLFFAVMIFIVTPMLKTTRREIDIEGLPEQFDGLRICHLSDFHLGSFGKGNPYIKRIVDAAMAEKPDVILFTGDLVNFDSAEADPYMPELSRLAAPMGIFAVRGNHDYLLHGHFTEEERLKDTERLLDMERSMGWKILLNANDRIRKDGAEIAIAGVENISTNPYFPGVGGDLGKALEGIPDGVFTILLSHDPTHWKKEVAGKALVGLTLSGHTHGLKYKLAGLHIPSWTFHQNAGVYEDGPQVLHVSVGLGSAFAFRLAGRPSVDILTLRKKL